MKSASRTLNGRVLNDATRSRAKTDSTLTEGAAKPMTSSRAMHSGENIVRHMHCSCLATNTVNFVVSILEQ